MKVFLSSTYVDLHDHRRATAHALELLGLSLWRMEALGARPDDAITVCLDGVEQSEIFVGIYAHRYGFVPSGSSISVTHMEFEHAHRLRRPTFCFLIDPAYPWPVGFVDADLQRERLLAFKATVESLVVRSLFTTPDVLATQIAASVGRYLIADPRKHGASTAADYARLILADVATAAFVDVMRLACTAASGEARSANAGRRAEFVDVADQHFSELRTQVTRLASAANYELMQAADGVERGIAHSLTRLRREPSLDRPWAEFMTVLHELAERVYALARAVSSDYVGAREGEVAEVLNALAGAVPPASLTAPLPFLLARHEAQSAVLRAMKARGGFAIATVRDDVDRRLAMPYFLVDLALLRHAHSIGNTTR